MEKQTKSISRILEDSIQWRASSSFMARKVIRIIAAELRAKGQQANTYDKQDQWEAAAKLVEGME